jgi:phage-related protein
MVEVQGRDGQYVFEDGYNNIQIDFSCAIGGYEILERRKKAREIAVWLSTTGKLVLDSEPDVEYKVIKSVNDISSTISSREYKDEFTISFECEQFVVQTFYNDGLTWEDMDSSWPYTNIPWDGYERKFTVSANQTVTVVNAGLINCSPVIILTGTASSVVLTTVGKTVPNTCTITNLSGTLYIDCKNKLVYSISGDSKINRIGNFSGIFPELKPGSNQFLVTGITSNILVEFDYKNTYR